VKYRALLCALALASAAEAQAPPSLLHFSAVPTPQVGDCVAVQSITSSGVTAADAGVGACTGASTGRVVAYATPTTGFAITIANATAVEILNPAGTLATGTLTMPAAPGDTQEVCISSSQTITAITVSANAGQSIVAPPTAMSAGGFCYIYNLAATTWFRLY
jgi:hypothetical protein